MTESPRYIARSAWRRHAVGCGVLVLAAAAMFGDVLAAGTTRLLSIAGEDTTRPFFYWLPFGFGELARGHLVLWNPHNYAGTPFFGGFGPALLYPPNWLHMALPTAVAINLTIALHVLLAGVFVYGWATHRRLHPAACVLAGLLFMFCGAHFWQIYRGHLHCLTTLAWAPLIFLAIDGVLADGGWRWPLVGMTAVAMQVLAGHVQYTFYTAIIASFYALLGWMRSQRRGRDAAALLAIYGGGALLSSMQLATGLQTALESHRTALSWDMASWFAFPPENLVTTIMPSFFGDMTSAMYWGRGTLSEMCLFIGVTPFVLMLAGIVHGDRRRAIRDVATIGLVLLLAFGSYTPLFRLLYDHVPGFASFRGTTKFIFLAALFMVMAAAEGCDRLLATRTVPTWITLFAFFTGAALLSAGASLASDCARGGLGIWRDLLASPLGRDGYQYFVVDQAPESAAACRLAARSLQIAGTTFLLVGALALATRWRGRLVYALAIVGVLEVFVYARYTRATFDPRPLPARSAALRAALAAAGTGDARVLSGDPYSYVAMGAGALDLWGAEPTVLDRYTRFIAVTQGWPLDALLVAPGFRTVSPLLGMLRLRYRVAFDEHERLLLSPTRLPELPRAVLVPRWRVVPEAADALAAVAAPGFDPAAEAILEDDPGLGAASDTAAATGPVTVRDVSTEVLEIRADTDVPALLVITDNYSASWRAEPWDAGDHRAYRVVPANYLVRGIPLAPGTHHIRLEYRPSALRWSALANAASLALYGAAVATLIARRRRVPSR